MLTTKIAIFGHNIQNSFNETIGTLFDELTANNVQILLYKQFQNSLNNNLYYYPKILKTFSSPADIDPDTNLIISVGGDGTFLECANMILKKQLPIVGINTGRLGFLSSVSKNDIKEAINNLLTSQYTIEKRTLLDVHIDNKKNNFNNHNYALNELTIQKKDNSSMIKIKVILNGAYLNDYWADGLIVSTPTGSSAYSLSAGGPIIIPGTNSFAITPISPHTLTVRPIIVPDNVKLEITVHGRGTEFLASLDSKTAFVKYNTQIFVEKSKDHLKMIKFKNTDYFTVLRKKLMWGLDIRN